MLSASSSRKFFFLQDPVTLPPELQQAYVAIGNFDGLHLGHQSILTELHRWSCARKRPSFLLTFEPHPADFFDKKRELFRLTPPVMKAKIAAYLGLNGLVCLNFTPSLAQASAEEFVEEILIRRLNISGALVGENFHFGTGRSGTAAYLQILGRDRGLDVGLLPMVEKTSSRRQINPISSTRIRTALEEGNVEEANHLLGYEYNVFGVVKKGEQRGRTLGYPTINVFPSLPIRIKYGIYAVYVRVENQFYAGAASYGERPTFERGPARLEVYIFNFNRDIYDQPVEVFFVNWLRGEEKFADIAALMSQIEADCLQAQALLKEHSLSALAAAPLPIISVAAGQETLL